jgi:hypothetical protein
MTYNPASVSLGSRPRAEYWLRALHLELGTLIVAFALCTLRFVRIIARSAFSVYVLLACR